MAETAMMRQYLPSEKAPVMNDTRLLPPAVRACSARKIVYAPYIAAASDAAVMPRMAYARPVSCDACTGESLDVPVSRE